ncbi:MAG: PAS domain-containing protein, partial [Nannocystaceae bacterium]
MSSNKIDTSHYRPGMLWKRSPMATIVCTMVEGVLVIKAINPRMLVLLGLEQPLATGLLATEILPAFVATPARLVEFENVATGGPETPCLDFEVVHPEGDEVHTAYQVFAYGGDPGTVAIQLHDITARKRNDERLLRQRDTQQDILDLLPQAVYWLDKNGAYAGGNQALCKILGVSRVEELLGKQVQEVGGVLLDLQASRSGDPSLPRDTEGEFVRPDDNTTRTVLMRTIALHGRDGTASGELGILNDISALKQVERELVAHKETLE